ncbi:unnamed protein product [Schistosoma rodhaini]|nr:unnamed protein product [Schistosoma rodhaini]
MYCELVRLLSYSPAGDWSEVEASLVLPPLPKPGPGSSTSGSESHPSQCKGGATVKHSHGPTMETGNSVNTSCNYLFNNYRRGWVPTSYLATANVFQSSAPSKQSYPQQLIGCEGSEKPNCSVNAPCLSNSQSIIANDNMQSRVQNVSNKGPVHHVMMDSSPLSLLEPSLLPYSWYHGAVSRQAGEHLLRSGITGSFLVRASESAPGQLSVTVRHLGRVYHYRISQDSRGLFYITEAHRFPTVVQLIEHHSRSADGLVCPLLYSVPKPQFLNQPMQQSCYSSVPQTLPSSRIPGPNQFEVNPIVHQSNAEISNFPLTHINPVSHVPRPFHPSHINNSERLSACSDSIGSMEFDGWEIDRSEIIMRQKLGCGQYGDVYEAVWKRFNSVVAVKTLKQDVNLNVNDFLKEAAIMKKLRNRNLVQLLGVCTREPPLYLITEYMPNGNLLNYLRSKQYFHSKAITDRETGTNMDQPTNCFSSNNQNLSQLKASSEQNNITVDESSLNHNNSNSNNSDIKDLHSNTSYSKISQPRRRIKVDTERAVSGNAGHLDYPGVGRRHLPLDDRSEEESNTEEVPRSLEDETLSIASDSPNNSQDNSMSIKPDADLSGGGEGDDVYQAPDSYYLPNINNSNSQNLQPNSTSQESITNLLERTIELVNWTKDLCSYCEMEYEIPNASFIELSNCLDSFRIELEAYIVEHISINPDLTKTILILCDNLGKQTTNLSLHLKTMEVDKPAFSVHCNSCHSCLKEIHEHIVQLLNKSKVTNAVSTITLTTGSTTSVTNQTHLHNDRSFSTTDNTTTTTHVFGKV